MYKAVDVSPPGNIDDNKKYTNTISAKNKINKTEVSATEEIYTEKLKTQTGIDRYTLVLKRGRSPNSSKVAPVWKIKSLRSIR